MELREKVARALFAAFDVAGLAVDLKTCTLVEAEVDLAAVADAILALPEIREALRLWEERDLKAGVTVEAYYGPDDD